MEQVLRNLLSNALKFSSDNSVVTVRVGFKPSNTKKDKPVSVGTPRSMRPVERMKNALSGIISKSTKLYAGTAAVAVAPNPPKKSVSERDGGNPGVDNDDGDENWVKGALVVTVTDTGAGISKENQKLLFREGQQFDPHKLQGGGGSGFGLFISRSIVVLHGGRIEAYSAGEGEGTSFSFTVPMRRAKADMDKAELDMQHAFRATSRYCTPAYRKPPGAPTFSPIQHALTRIGRPGPPCTHCKPTAMCRPHQRKVQTRNGGRRSACRCPGKGHN